MKKTQRTHQQDILLMMEVSKWPIFVDTSTSNNSIMREAAWEQVRNVVTLEREQWPSSKSISFSQTLNQNIFKLQVGVGVV